MTQHYYNLEFKLDAAHTPREDDHLMTMLLIEGERLLDINDGAWQGGINEWTEERDTQW